MARRTGRGLFLGKEDFIPLERVDILDDLKRFVDVHRLTDFTLSDKIIPTIELRRTEDEIIGAVGILAVGGIGRTTAQLFGEGAATGLGIVARPLSVVVTTEAVDNVYFGYLPFSGGAVVSISADPRRPVSELAGSGVHVDGTTVLMVQANTVHRARLLGNSPYSVPGELLQRALSLPGQCFTVQAETVGTNVHIAMTWRLERLRPTRAGPN